MKSMLPTLLIETFPYCNWRFYNGTVCSLVHIAITLHGLEIIIIL